jgi:hypothetical protein
MAAAHDAVGVGFEPVDFLAGLQRGFAPVRVGDLGQQLDRIPHALAALDAQVGQAGDLLRHVAHVVQAMVSAESWIRSATSSMVLISEWICSRSIGVMKVLCSLVDVVRDAVRGALGVVHILVVLLAQVGSL